MNDELSAVQCCIGQVRSLFYLLDEPTTIVTIQSDRQTITAHASGQVALSLRALPRDATISVALHHVLPDCPEVIAFNSMADDNINNPSARHEEE